MPSKKSGQKRMSAKAGSERPVLASASEPKEATQREFLEQPAAEVGSTEPTMPSEVVVETREDAVPALETPMSAVHAEGDVGDCADQGLTTGAVALAMPGGTAQEETSTLKVVPPEAQTEEAEKEEVQPTEQEEEFEEACEGEDFSDPLALLSGMGQEEIYAVTLVPEAEPESAEAEEPFEEGNHTAVVAAEEHEVTSEPAVAEQAEEEVASEPAQAEPEGQEAEDEPVVQAPGDKLIAATALGEDKLIAADFDEEATALGSPDVVSPVGSNAGGFSDTESTSCACRLSVVCDCTKPGEALAVVGAHSALGAWDPQRALVLSTSAEAFPVWTTDLPTDAMGSEFKLVIVRADGGATWEPIDSNRTWPPANQPIAHVTYGVACH